MENASTLVLADVVKALVTAKIIATTGINNLNFKDFILKNIKLIK
tara:strand:- start:2628 stop:2762 length:135 start_codon:yes stop_codon:yes gene_type:complete